MESNTKIRNVNKEHLEGLSRLDRFALWITRHVGTTGFFLLIAFWTAGWLLWNTFAAQEARFDPFPAFALWLFISNVIQISILPLIMIGQNLESRHSELRAQADFEVNIKAEQEVKVIMEHLERQDTMLREILGKLK